MRLDAFLAAKKMAKSRQAAKNAILRGAVYVDGNPITKPAFEVREDTAVEIRDTERYVSRGGYKLEHALKVFGIDPAAMRCADIGASTGGFTDCLLQHGAAEVAAIDVGRGQLDESLRRDSRVNNIEGINARDLDCEELGGPFDLAVTDVSFISAGLILPSIYNILRTDGIAICLIKPQFEVGRGKVGKGGLVKNPRHHEDVMNAFGISASNIGFSIKGMTYSPIKGAEGNIEFLCLLKKSTEDFVDINYERIVNDAHTYL